MTLAPEPRLWTYDDYRALPDDGNRYEAIDGKLYGSTPGKIWAKAWREGYSSCWTR